MTRSGTLGIKMREPLKTFELLINKYVYVTLVDPASITEIASDILVISTCDLSLLVAPKS